jgi:hypothetical protein
LRRVSCFPCHVDGGFAYVCLSGDHIVEYGGEVAAFEELLTFLLARRALTVDIPAAAMEPRIRSFVTQAFSLPFIWPQLSHI